MAKLPKFESDEELADFFDTHDSTDYLDDTEEVDVHFEFGQAAAPREQAKLPIFASEQEEAEFWDTHSVADYVNELEEVDTRFEFPSKKDGQNGEA